MPFDPSPYTIAGGLNFGSVPSPGDYMGAYGNALNINTQNYGNLVTGYQGLNQSVLGNIEGMDASERTNIRDRYAVASGKGVQDLVSRGLGNTTIQNSVARGYASDREKAETDLTNKTQGLYAGYQSQLGQAQLGMMERVSAPYPNVDAYNKNAMLAGMISRPQTALPQARQQQRDPFGMGGGGGGVSMPRSGGFGGLGGSQSGSGGSGGGQAYQPQARSQARPPGGQSGATGGDWNSGEDAWWASQQGDYNSGEDAWWAAQQQDLQDLEAWGVDTEPWTDYGGGFYGDSYSVYDDYGFEYPQETYTDYGGGFYGDSAGSVYDDYGFSYED